MYRRNNNWPKTLPCGTPDTTLTCILRQLSTKTCSDRFDKRLCQCRQHRTTNINKAELIIENSLMIYPIKGCARQSAPSLSPAHSPMHFAVHGTHKGASQVPRVAHTKAWARTLSGRTGKMVASHAEGCRVDSRQSLHRFILCTKELRGGGVCDQSIGSTVFDAIVHSWLWTSAKRSHPLGYFSSITANSS